MPRAGQREQSAANFDFLPLSVRISAAMPGNGRVAEPGLSVVTREAA